VHLYCLAAFKGQKSSGDGEGGVGDTSKSVQGYQQCKNVGVAWTRVGCNSASVQRVSGVKGSGIIG
jgi:hypothetical protein